MVVFLPIGTELGYDGLELNL